MNENYKVMAIGGVGFQELVPQASFCWKVFFNLHRFFFQNLANNSLEHPGISLKPPFENLWICLGLFKYELCVDKITTNIHKSIILDY